MASTARNVGLWRQRALTLALVAMIIRAFLPVGFMPSFGAEGTGIVICSGLSSKTIPDPFQKKHETEICAFSVNLSGLETAPAIIAPFAPAASRIISLPSAEAAIAVIRPYAPRAPPSA